MYSNKLETLIAGALADGVLEEREIEILRRKAQEEGVDPDEFEMAVRGRLAQEKSTQTPKSEKVGSVNKCPRCGAVLTGIEAKCPECGHMLTDLSAVNSAKAFADGMAASKGITNMRNFIINFPIPNSAKDLQEFAVMMKARIKNTPKADPLYQSYKVKLSEVEEKCRLLFPNDERFQSIFAKPTFKEFVKDNKIMLISGAASLIIIFGYLFGFNKLIDKYDAPAVAYDDDVPTVVADEGVEAGDKKTHASADKCIKDAMAAINEGDLSKASTILVTYGYDYSDYSASKLIGHQKLAVKFFPIFNELYTAYVSSGQPLKAKKVRADFEGSVCGGESYIYSDYESKWLPLN